MAAADPRITEALIEAVAGISQELILVVLAGSTGDALRDMERRFGIRIAFEAFADRAYNRDGTLVSRREKGAVIEDDELVAQRALKMATQSRVTAIDGTEIALKADTLCVHGDNPAAVRLVKRIREVLRSADVEVTAMKNFIKG